MPDDRLKRTREAVPTVPPCVRLGHFWREEYDMGSRICRRCALREWPVFDVTTKRWHAVGFGPEAGR